MAINRRTPADRYGACEQYLMPRLKALTLTPAALNIKLTADDQAYGVIVDIPMGPSLLGTLICLPNGSVSLYFNNGESVTGYSAKYPAVAQSCRTLLLSIGQVLPACRRSSEFDLPIPNQHNLHILTRKGVYKTVIVPSDLEKDGNKLCKYAFFLYQNVMTQMNNAQLKERAARNK